MKDRNVYKRECVNLSMGYVGKRDQVRNFIIANIIPSVKLKDLDFYSVLKVICQETGCTKEIAIDTINSFVPNCFKEVRILTIPDEQIEDFLITLKKEEHKIKKEVDEGKNLLDTALDSKINTEQEKSVIIITKKEEDKE